MRIGAHALRQSRSGGQRERSDWLAQSTADAKVGTSSTPAFACCGDCGGVATGNTSLAASFAPCVCVLRLL